MDNKLGKELFEQMQEIQGQAFISDAVESLSDIRVLETAIIALEWQKEGVKVLRSFLKTHLTQRAADGCQAGHHLVLGRSRKCLACGERVERRR